MLPGNLLLVKARVAIKEHAPEVMLGGSGKAMKYNEAARLYSRSCGCCCSPSSRCCEAVTKEICERRADRLCAYARLAVECPMFPVWLDKSEKMLLFQLPSSLLC